MSVFNNNPPTVPVLNPGPFLFDEVYNDPEAEIIFFSTEGIGFRVYKYLVERASQSLREKYASPDRIYWNTIYTTVPTIVLRAFISFMYSTTLNLAPSISCPVTVKNLLMLLQTVNQYRCDTMHKVIIQCWAKQASGKPWVMFSIASANDNVEMAKTALRSMGDEDWKKLEKYDEMNYEVFEDISKPYLFELLRLRGACFARFTSTMPRPAVCSSSLPHTAPGSKSESTPAHQIASRSNAMSGYSSTAPTSCAIQKEREEGANTGVQWSAAYWEDIANRFAPRKKG